MAISWFICPYKRMAGRKRPTRYCVVEDFGPQIRADAGAWAASEILGDCALVKVRANADTLAAIGTTAGVIRLPKVNLSDPLSDLTGAQKTAIRNKLIAMGYAAGEIQAAVGADIGSVALGDVLRFAASRRLKPRYDKASDTIFLDGQAQPVRTIQDVDGAV